MGYLRTSDGPSPLPVGSHLEPTTGVFTWAPGVGFVGSYDFVFLRLAGERAVARQDVRIVIAPKGSGSIGAQVVDRHAALAAGRPAAVCAGRVVGGFECDTRRWRCDAACMGLSVVRWSARIPRSDELRLHAAGRGGSARRAVRRVGLRATRSRTAAWELRPGGLRVEYRDRRVCAREGRPRDRPIGLDWCSTRTMLLGAGLLLLGGSCCGLCRARVSAGGLRFRQVREGGATPRGQHPRLHVGE